MKTGLILMTALPPTLGHKYLIDFAKEFLNSISYGNALYVVINARPHEPLKGEERVPALREACPEAIICLHEDMFAPQFPDGSDEFWNYWAEIPKKIWGNAHFDYVFASEDYGKELAHRIGAEFVICDKYRTTLKTSGTAIRTDILENFDYILPKIQRKYRKIITIFGPESVGKTTITNNIFKYAPFKVTRVAEWARGYLETVGPEITDEKWKELFLVNMLPKLLPITKRNLIRSLFKIPIFYLH